MQLGFAVPLAGSWATPDNQVELGCRAEELGYASLWTFQRLLFPADPAATEAPQRWPPVYRSVHDPLVTLAFLAAHTSRVRLGVAVVNMPWFRRCCWPSRRRPSTPCRKAGSTWASAWAGPREEYEAAGAPFDRRGVRADEFLQACEAIWTQELVEVKGEFHQIPASVRGAEAGAAPAPTAAARRQRRRRPAPSRPALRRLGQQQRAGPHVDRDVDRRS